MPKTTALVFALFQVVRRVCAAHAARTEHGLASTAIATCVSKWGACANVVGAVVVIVAALFTGPTNQTVATGRHSPTDFDVNLQEPLPSSQSQFFPTSPNP